VVATGNKYIRLVYALCVTGVPYQPSRINRAL
jgi:hypothetical protein